MKKKILIGSIIAVVILILVSFTSVVGFQSVKSDSKIASPLFKIRTNRAINKEQDAVTSDYIGKYRDVSIFRGQRYNNILSVQKLIERINEMDEGEIENLDKEKLINALIKIKNKPYEFNELINHLNVFKKVDAPVYYTVGEPWYPGCFLEFISLIVIGIVGFFWLLYIFTHPTYMYTCDPCPT